MRIVVTGILYALQLQYLVYAIIIYYFAGMFVIEDYCNIVIFLIYPPSAPL